MKLKVGFAVTLLGLVLFGVVEQHQAHERAKRAEAERTLSECWHNAVANQTGGELCKALADTLDK